LMPLSVVISTMKLPTSLLPGSAEKSERIAL
jgi:hypothetical protein